jgi:hypothetical protein
MPTIRQQLRRAMPWDEDDRAAVLGGTDSRKHPPQNVPYEYRRELWLDARAAVVRL